MFNVSSGRIFASYVYPESLEEKSAETKQWVQSVGLKPIQVCGHSTGVDGQYYRRDGKNVRYVQVQQRVGNEWPSMVRAAGQGGLAPD